MGNDEIKLLARSFGRSLSRLNFNSNYFWLKINEFTGGSGEPYPFALRSKPEVAACVRIYSLIACDDGNRQAMTSRKIYRLIIPHNRITHTHWSISLARAQTLRPADAAAAAWNGYTTLFAFFLFEFAMYPHKYPRRVAQIQHGVGTKLFFISSE